MVDPLDAREVLSVVIHRSVELDLSRTIDANKQPRGFPNYFCYPCFLYFTSCFMKGCRCFASLILKYLTNLFSWNSQLCFCLFVQMRTFFVQVYATSLQS